MPRTLSKTTAEAKSQLRENRCLDPSMKSDLGAGKLHCTICPTIPDHGSGSPGHTGGRVGRYMPLSYLRMCNNKKKKSQCIQRPMKLCQQYERERLRYNQQNLRQNGYFPNVWKRQELTKHIPS